MRIFLLWCLYDWSLQVYDKHSATLSIKIFQWGSLRKYFTFFFIDSVRLVGTNLSSPPHSFSTLFIATFKEIIFNASYLGLFNVSFSISTRKRKLSNLLHLVARVEAVGDSVLVDVESRQPQRQLVLQLRGEPLLHHVVAALKEEEHIFMLYTNILYLNGKLNIFNIVR